MYDIISLLVFQTNNTPPSITNIPIHFIYNNVPPRVQFFSIKWIPAL